MNNAPFSKNVTESPAEREVESRGKKEKEKLKYLLYYLLVKFFTLVVRYSFWYRKSERQIKSFLMTARKYRNFSMAILHCFFNISLVIAFTESIPTMVNSTSWIDFIKLNLDFDSSDISNCSFYPLKYEKGEEREKKEKRKTHQQTFLNFTEIQSLYVYQ